MTCTFFGHRDCPVSCHDTFKEVLIELIKSKSVTRFLVGNQGVFDRIVLQSLRELKCERFAFEYVVVLAYFPTTKPEGEALNQTHTMVFQDVEKVPPRYAIDRRNAYMLSQSQYVVTYVKGTTGGAYKFYTKALQQQKTVINIAEL